MHSLSLLFLLFGTVWCWGDDSANDLQDLTSKIGEIPGLERLNSSNVPSIEDVQDVIKKKCEKNGGEEAFNKLNASQETLKGCLQDHFNVTVIQEEVETAKKSGSMDEVFVKYCAKTPIVQECIRNFSKNVEPCLEEKERGNLKLLFNVSDQVAEFVCFKDGDRIAMFVAEGGVECLDSQKEGLQECFNETLSHRMSDELNINSLPLFMIDSQECDDYNKLHSCVVKKLERCQDNTPANIVDALFKFIRRATPCKNHVTKVVPSSQRTRRYVAELEETFEKYKKVRDSFVQSMSTVCRANGGERTFDDLQTAMLNFEQCVKNQQTVFNSSMVQRQDPIQHLCSKGFKEIRNCTRNLVRKIEACTNTKRWNLSNMGFEIFDSTRDYLCKDDSKAFKTIASQGSVCMDKLGNEASKCMTKVNHLNPTTLGTNVTRTELCSELSTVKNCLVSLISDKCADLEFGKTTVNELASAVYAPCSGCSTHLNTVNFESVNVKEHSIKVLMNASSLSVHKHDPY